MSSTNAAFVGSIPENYDRYLGPILFEPYAAALVEQLHLPANASVLELACGTGIVTRRLRDRLDPAAKIVATDLNEAMLACAARKFTDQDQVEWKQADATNLPFADCSFDAVVCQFGLMFFPDKHQAVREAYRVLKPGGVFVFNVWDAIELNDLPNLAHTIISDFFDDNPPDFYEIPFSFHDPETIKALLTEAGFKQVQTALVPFAAIGQSAHETMKGLVHGNPVINAIRERDESRLPEIEATIEAAIKAQFGDRPVRAQMQALACSAVREL